MPPLTSQSGCESCSHLTQKISELEGRISVIYQIREDEKTIDSMVSFCPAPTMTVPCAVSASTQPGVPWNELGAKPKALANSTPLLEPWTVAGNRRGRRSSHAPPSQGIKPINRFEILDEQEFPFMSESSRLRVPPPASFSGEFRRSPSPTVHSAADAGQPSRLAAPRRPKPNSLSARQGLDPLLGPWLNPWSVLTLLLRLIQWRSPRCSHLLPLPW